MPDKQFQQNWLNEITCSTCSTFYGHRLFSINQFIKIKFCIYFLYRGEFPMNWIRSYGFRFRPPRGNNARILHEKPKPSAQYLIFPPGYIL